MTRRPVRPSARLAALALAAVACRDADAACFTPPCALPVAVEVTALAPGGATPPITIAVSGAASSASVVPCQVAAGTTCLVLGGAGTYELDVSAPGYRSEHRTVTVGGTTARCGCGTVDTQRVTVPLTPAAGPSA